VELHDEEQALVAERLRAANGAPVSFAELREMGVENPALLGYELAAVGLAVERQRTNALTLAVSPDQVTGAPPPTRPPDGVETPSSRERFPEAPNRANRASRALSLPRPRVRPSVAAGVALGVVVALGALALALGGRPANTTTSLVGTHVRGRPPARHGVASSGGRVRSRPDGGGALGTAARSERSASPTAAPNPSAIKPKPPVSPASAATFEAAGHQLLMAGQYGSAIGDLRNAVSASGGSLTSCSQPTTEACLTYAYALYDLGRALALAGDPAAAVPVLRERLQIDNQREVVEQELDLARRAST
jgi:hypothetical protein